MDRKQTSEAMNLNEIRRIKKNRLIVITVGIIFGWFTVEWMDDRIYYRLVSFDGACSNRNRTIGIWWVERINAFLVGHRVHQSFADMTH